MVAMRQNQWSSWAGICTLDSKAILTVILCGDNLLRDRFRMAPTIKTTDELINQIHVGQSQVVDNGEFAAAPPLLPTSSTSRCQK